MFSTSVETILSKSEGTILSKSIETILSKSVETILKRKKIPSEFITKSHKSLTGSLALSFHRKKSSSKFYYIQNKTVVMENDDRGIRSFPKVQLYKKFWWWTSDHLHWIRTVCDLCAFWTDILDPKNTLNTL